MGNNKGIETTVRLREWIGPPIYGDARDIEKHIFNKDLTEIKPAGRMGSVVFWDLPSGKYLLLDIEKPSLITQMYDYVIVCLSIENIAGATSIKRTPLAYVRFPDELVNKNRELFNNMILTLMQQLQSICQ